MSELKSKCCGAKVKIVHSGYSTVEYGGIEKYYECQKCHQPTEVEEKAKQEGQQKYVDDFQRRRW